MKCYYHEDRDAVATCPSCGKFLCRECASKYNPCYCEECIDIFQKKGQQYDREVKEDRVKGLIKRLIIGIALALLVIITGQDGTSMPYLVGAILLCLPFGYHALTELGRRANLIIFINWIFIVLKVCIAFMIGPFALVWEIIGLFRDTGAFTVKKIPGIGDGEQAKESAKKAAAKVGGALSSGKKKAREVYDSHVAQRSARTQEQPRTRTQIQEEPELTYSLDDLVSKPEINLSKCVKPQAEMVDGDKKLRLSVDSAAFVNQLGDAREQFRSNMTALRELFESVRPRASKTEFFQSGDVVNVTIDYDWELAEELGIEITGTKFRMTAK